MPNRKVIRWGFDITEKQFASSSGQGAWTQGTFELQENYPIDFAGAALLVANDTGVDVEVSIQDSADGSTWAPVQFSTLTAAGNLTVTVHEQSYVVVLFTTTARFVRFRARDSAGDPVVYGLFCHLCEFEPENARGVGQVY